MPDWYADPASDTSNSGWTTEPVPAGNIFDHINKGTHYSSTPATTSDVTTGLIGTGTTAIFEVVLTNPATAANTASIIIRVNGTFPVRLPASVAVTIKKAGGSYLTAVTWVPGTGGQQWFNGATSFAFTGLTWTPTEVNGITVKVSVVGQTVGRGGLDSTTIYEVQAEGTLAAATFQPAWAAGSNHLLGGGDLNGGQL